LFIGAKDLLVEANGQPAARVGPAAAAGAHSISLALLRAKTLELINDANRAGDSQRQHHQ
jgi:hypothetical protein